SHTGYVVENRVIPAPPVTTFNFLLANDLIRSNHINTVGRLFEWSHLNMRHVGFNPQSPLYNLDTLQQDVVWQYRVYAPAAGMMAMTVYTDPFTNETYGTGKQSWAYGCTASASFAQATLRAVNIPVVFVNPAGLTGHSTALFPTIGQTLVHADD